MGYCVEWKGRLSLDRPLDSKVAAAMRACEDSEAWPGDTPDRRFNPWCLTEGNDGLEVLTDKPGDWKAWLQYTLDHWLTPRGYALSGSVEWDGEERADCGVITTDSGKVKARKKVPCVKWADVSARVKAHIGEQIENAMAGDRGHEADAWLAALAHLGIAPDTDRTKFDE